MKIKLRVSRRSLCFSILITISTATFFNTYIIRCNSFTVSWRKILEGCAIRNIRNRNSKSLHSQYSSSTQPCLSSLLIPGPDPLQVFRFNFDDLLRLNVFIYLVWWVSFRRAKSCI